MRCGCLNYLFTHCCHNYQQGNERAEDIDEFDMTSLSPGVSHNNNTIRDTVRILYHQIKIFTEIFPGDVSIH